MISCAKCTPVFARMLYRETPSAHRECNLPDAAKVIPAHPRWECPLNSVAQLERLPSRQATTINGSLFEYTTAGEGRPVIVLLAGAGGPIESWFRIHESLASFGTVFAWNRAGVGGSDAPTTPQTGECIVATLRALLAHIGLAPPYVLVGHSLGGLYANLFARRFSEEVAGVVLLEAAAPGDVADAAMYASTLQRFVQRIATAIAPPNEFSETEHVRETVEQIHGAGSFPDVPLVVVTGGKPAMSWLTPEGALQARDRHQRALAKLSPRGRHVFAETSGHFPQFTQPRLVIDAVREVVSAVSDPRASLASAAAATAATAS